MDKKKYWFFGSKFYNSRLNTILLFVLIILMIIALRFMIQDKEKYFPSGYKLSQWDKGENAAYSEYKKKTLDRISGSNPEDYMSFSIYPDSKVSGPVSFFGVAPNNYFFEANILVNVLDLNKEVIKSSHGTASNGDWMIDQSVDFTGSIDFTGLPKGPAYFEIHNDNASGLPEHDKSILIPIIID